MAGVAELWCYPIKSCAGVPVDDAMLTPAGLAHDRTFMVVGPDGVARTQRRDPRLALIRPDITTPGDQLTLHARGVDAARVAVDLDAPRRAVTLFGTVYRGIDQGDAVAEWITGVLGASSRLVRVPPEHRRATDGLVPGTSAYADSCPVHVLSLPTLTHLNARIADRAARPVPMARFRPNIVVDGWDEPHAEDQARDVTIGDAALGYAKTAIRCVTTMVDQGSGAKAGPEPLRTLSTYRRAPEGGVAFGAKFAVVRPGKLAVGDEVTVERWSY